MRYACFFVILLGAARASAQAVPPSPPEERELLPEAQAHVDEAHRYIDEKNYDAAISELSAAYAIDPDPRILYDQAQAERLAGRCAEAIETYRAFLQTNPSRDRADSATLNIGKCQLRVPAPKPPPPKVIRVEVPPPDIWYRDSLGLTLSIVGVAGIGLSATELLLARRHGNLADDATTFGDYQRHYDVMKRDRTIGVIAGGAGVVLLTVGIIRFSF